MEKADKLAATVESIKRQFGKGAVMRLGDAPEDFTTNVIPSGSLALDIALGVGGLPRGRVVEVFGPEGSGKSTLALQVVASCQRMSGNAVYVDAENAIDIQYAAALGVNTDELLISQVDTGEQGLEIANLFVKSGAVDVIVIDSVAALVPKAELEGEIGDSHVGLQARLMSQALRIMSHEISQAGCIVIFINQLREKIGVMFGSPEVTPGGRALKFYSSIRLDMRRIDAVKKGNDIIGNRTKVRVVKNKVAPPLKIAEFDIVYGRGVSHEGELVDLGVKYGLVDKKGAWFTYGDTQLGQGMENSKQMLELHPDVAAEIEEGIRIRAGLLERDNLDPEAEVEDMPAEFEETAVS